MRLWHKDIIKVLPTKQLVAQWRECCCIAAKVAMDGTPNHLLVNKILLYPQTHFVEYCNLIIREMEHREYKINEKSYMNLCMNLEKGFKYFNNENPDLILFNGWHNDRYLLQCYFNLEEKYDCGMFDENEYLNLYSGIMDKFIKMEEDDEWLK